MYTAQNFNKAPPVFRAPAIPQPTPIYLYDEIGDPIDYCELIYILDHAQEGEEVHLHIATGGGSMESAITIVHAIRRTNATVVGFADGGVASAGTFILLSCHVIVIEQFAHFLFHDGSIGTPPQKFSENLKQAIAITRLYKEFAMAIYKPFFTDEEVETILSGTDFYLSADEMIERVRIVQKDGSVDTES